MLHNAAKQVVEKHGGIVDKYIGDSVMAVFGARINNRGVAAGLAIATVIAGTLTTGLLLTLDWAFVLRQAIAVLEAAVAMSFMLAAFRSRVPRPWSVFALAGPALFVLAVVYAVPRLAAASGSAAPGPAAVPAWPAEFGTRERRCRPAD